MFTLQRYLDNSYKYNMLKATIADIRYENVRNILDKYLDELLREIYGLDKEELMTIVNVKMDKEDILDLLYNRLLYWTDEDTAELFCKMYDLKIEQGVFDNCLFNVKNIVDNDYINKYRVFSSANDSDTFKFLLKEYDNNNYYLDGTNEYGLYLQIVTVSDDRQKILVRY